MHELLKMEADAWKTKIATFCEDPLMSEEACSPQKHVATIDLGIPQHLRKACTIRILWTLREDQKEELPPSQPTESLVRTSTVDLRASRAAQLDMDLDVDEAMDSLDFGLFSPNASFGELLYQCLPVVWVAVVSLWPGLLSSFLRMIWCVPIWEEDVVSRSRLRLLPNPDVVCWSDEHFPSAALAVSGLVVWCVGIPLVLAAKLSLEDRTSPDKHRRYGFFFQGLEPQYWWWDILVKRADVGLMMLVTYTSVVREPEAKVLLFPLLSGLQALLAASSGYLEMCFFNCWVLSSRNQQQF